MPAGLRPGQIGSPQANAIAAAIEFDRVKAADTLDFVPSRLFIYHNERHMEHTVGSDAGAQIRDGIKSIAGLWGLPRDRVAV